jgi:hypothetical protein
VVLVGDITTVLRVAVASEFEIEEQVPSAQFVADGVLEK